MSYLKSFTQACNSKEKKRNQFLQTLRLQFIFKVFKETDEEA